MATEKEIEAAARGICGVIGISNPDAPLDDDGRPEWIAFKGHAAAALTAAEQVRASEPQLREQLRDHFAKVMHCQLPCACLRNPQKNDCGALADMALALRPFTVAVD